MTMQSEQQQQGDAAAQAAAAAAAAGALSPEAKATADKAAADAAALAAGAQTPEQKAAAEKAAAEAGRGKAPEKYEAFKLPDGVAFAPELQAGLEGLAKKHGMTQESAQELASFAAAQLQGIDQKAGQLRADWRAAAEKDPEIGGDKLAPALAASAQVIATFGGKDASEFKDFLDKSGLGNHPVLVRVLARVRGAISDDKFVSGDKAPPAKDARTLYPNSNMNP